MAPAAPPPETARLSFTRFTEADEADLAAILADPEITRTITADGSSPARCAAAARKRIAWHNGSWDNRGYGVWALKARNDSFAPAGRLLGWCGFTPPDVEAAEPEILYGLARACWGRGLATEAARGAITWLFETTDYPGVSALIMGRLNLGSVKVTEKLGMTRHGTMAFKEFLPDAALARDVLNFEIWRLREGDSADSEALLFQAPYKAGQIAATGVAEPSEVEAALCAAARARPGLPDMAPKARDASVRTAFRQGMAEDCMEWYRLTRESWRSANPHPAAAIPPGLR